MAWILLNDAMLSIVQPAPGNHRKARNLLVRARREGDIKAVFPEVNVIEDENRDYRFRAFIHRDRVADAIAGRIACINYGNFKDSVPDKKRKSIYSRVWSELLELAPKHKPGLYNWGSKYMERFSLRHYQHGAATAEAETFIDEEPLDMNDFASEDDEHPFETVDLNAYLDEEERADPYETIADVNDADLLGDPFAWEDAEGNRGR